MTPSASGSVWMLDMNGNGVFELGFTTSDNLWHFDFDISRTDDTSGPVYTQYAGGEVLNTQYATAFPVIGDWTGDRHFTTRIGKGVLVGASVIGFGANAAPVTGSWATVRTAD